MSHNFRMKFEKRENKPSKVNQGLSFDTLMKKNPMCRSPELKVFVIVGDVLKGVRLCSPTKSTISKLKP